MTAFAPQMVISDLDGTLIRRDKTLSKANIAAVRRLTATGVAFALISARPPSGMRWIADALGIDGHCGAFNGGTIFDPLGAILEAHRLDAELARAISEYVVEAGAICWVFADGDWLTNATDVSHTPREVKSAGVDPIVGGVDLDRYARADKLVAVSDDDALLTRIERDVRAIAGDRATIARSQPYYLDITAPAANKGHGVERLAGLAGVPLDRVAVLGDADNDLPMFARAGFAVAMGQASERVKAAADVIVTANDDEGVADAIDRLFLLARAAMA